MPKLNGISLISPAESFKDDYEAHEQEEKDEDYKVHNASSLCNACRFGFVVHSSESPYDAEPQLNIWCTAPWFGDHAHAMTNVANCNGFVAGSLDVSQYEEEALSKALDDMEKESDEMKKAFPPDADERKDKEESDEPDPTAPPKAEPDDEEDEEGEEAKEDEKEDEDKD